MSNKLESYFHRLDAAIIEAESCIGHVLPPLRPMFRRVHCEIYAIGNELSFDKGEAELYFKGPSTETLMRRQQLAEDLHAINPKQFEEPVKVVYPPQHHISERLSFESIGELYRLNATALPSTIKWESPAYELTITAGVVEAKAICKAFGETIEVPTTHRLSCLTQGDISSWFKKYGITELVTNADELNDGTDFNKVFVKALRNIRDKVSEKHGITDFTDFCNRMLPNGHWGTDKPTSRIVWEWRTVFFKLEELHPAEVSLWEALAIEVTDDAE